MNNTNDYFDYQIFHLTQHFFDDYPSPPYDEIIRKSSRPYNCLLVQSHYGYFICISYRSHINHKHAYKFKNSERSKRTKSGLDYSKIVIVINSAYISSVNTIVDKDEFAETRDNIEYIKKDAQRYIDDYVAYIQGQEIEYDEKEFNRTYQYSTLKYFHKELGIEKLKNKR